MSAADLNIPAKHCTMNNQGVALVQFVFWGWCILTTISHSTRNSLMIPCASARQIVLHLWPVSTPCSFHFLTHQLCSRTPSVTIRMHIVSSSNRHFLPCEVAKAPRCAGSRSFPSITIVTQPVHELQMVLHYLTELLQDSEMLETSADLVR